MTRFLINAALALIIAVGGISLTMTTAAASATIIGECGTCPEGYDVKCDDDKCCSICESTGELCECKKVE